MYCKIDTVNTDTEAQFYLQLRVVQYCVNQRCFHVIKCKPCQQAENSCNATQTDGTIC